MAEPGERAGDDAGNAFSSLEHLAHLLATGAASSEELTRRYLDRIKRINSDLHAFSDLFAERALTDARARDRGRIHGERRPTLWGVPIAVKDIFDIAGLVTSAGSKALPDQRAAVSAHAVNLLERAGMVVLGRTHMVEFAFGGWGTNPVMGAPRNPWDRDAHRVAGGSSSGSAVAVAAGLAPAALGTDTGGSVRTPATWCGVIGMKTSHGLIGRGGAAPLCPTHDSIGCLTRTVRDAALLLTVLQGADPHDAATIDAPIIDPFDELEQGVKGLRIGRLTSRDLQGIEPDILDLHDKALADLAELGAAIAPIRLPMTSADYLAGGGGIMSYESFAALGGHVERSRKLVDPIIADRIMAGRDIGEAAYRRMLDERRRAEAEFTEVARDVDAFVLPGAHRSPPCVDEVDEGEPPNLFGRLVNYLDLAALAAPTGLTGKGLPAGIQIVVRKYQDARALRIGRALERHRGGLVHAPPGC